MIEWSVEIPIPAYLRRGRALSGTIAPGFDGAGGINIMANRIAIDFGTTRTKVAFQPSQGRQAELLRFGDDRYMPYIPSLFYLPEDGGPILFGDAAESMLDRHPGGVLDTPKRRRRSELVRAGNGRSASFADLLRALFAQLRHSAGENIPAFANQPPTEVVLTVPVGFGQIDRERWHQAALHAGFAKVIMLDEPVAAAAAWLDASHGVTDDVIVLDCGGGTVDWAWVRNDGATLSASIEVPPEGIVDLGGHDVDIALLELVEARLAERGVESIEFNTTRRPRLLNQVRRAKEAAGRGEAPDPIAVGTESVPLSREDIIAESSARFLSAVRASFGAFLQRVAGANGGERPPRAAGRWREQATGLARGD